MNDLFQVNSPVIRFLTRLCDWMMLSILLTLLCATVICSGAAVTALYATMLKMVRGEGGRTSKLFFRKLRESFIPSFQATILLFIDVMLLAILYYAIYAETLVFSPVIFVLLAMTAVFLTAVLSYLFPLLGRFENTFPQHLKNAVRLALANLPVTILMTLVNLLPLLSIILCPDAMPYFAAFWPLVGVAALANVNSFYLNRIFKR